VTVLYGNEAMLTDCNSEADSLTSLSQKWGSIPFPRQQCDFHTDYIVLIMVSKMQ
jgi:hypothetical protein